MCMVDINNFYGLIRFLKAAKRAGLKPLTGVTIAPDGGSSFTALCLNASGFARANRIITSLLATGRAEKREAQTVKNYCAGKPEDLSNPGYDPMEDLVENGWDGLWIVSSSIAVLERLLNRDRNNIFAGLTWGRPFARLSSWARKREIPLLAVNEGVYLGEEEQNLYHLLRAIDLNTTVDRLTQQELPLPEYRIVSDSEMERFFSAVPDAIYNAQRFAEEADIRGILREEYIFPRFNGYSQEEAYRLLKRLCLDGVTRRYGSMRPDIHKRLFYELSIIRKKGFSDYFLVVYDIVKRCPRTCGRGSSASSIVSYLLGITHVDPLKHNLFFERFLNEGRKDPPDIDVDFPWDERDRALSYVFQRYRGRAGMVADHVTFGSRSSLREAARAAGLPESEIEKIIRQSRYGSTGGIPEYLLRAGERLKGMPRHIGTHPGGVVITPGPITDYTHLQPSQTGFPVIAWEKDATEDAGLVKIDLLGNRSLAVLRDCIELVNKKRKSPITWEQFNPIGDEKTRRLIEHGDTLGVFYIESPATRQLLKKMGRGDYEHLVIASSIIRPAANKYIREFVQRLRGGEYTALHPLLGETLRETLGIMVYQEDVARVAIKVAGFSPAEADALRKILSKKDRELRLDAYRERFFLGGAKQGVDRGTMEKLWEMILSFEGYSFCKAHSASYALVSYRLAWLKCYYPLEFLVSVINNRGGFYAPQVYLDAAMRMGAKILPPDVNESQWECTVSDGAIRIGLSWLKSIPRSFIQQIIREREAGGKYRSFFDFIHRLSPEFSRMRVLIRSGSLDSVAEGLSRPQLFLSYFHTNKNYSLFGLTPPVAVGDYSWRTRVLDEVRTFGLVISCHPLEIFSGIPSKVRAMGLPRLIDSDKILKNVGRRVTIAGMLIAGKEVLTRNRSFMSFVSFEDPYSVFETVLFPRDYERLKSKLDTGVLFLVIGKVTEELGVCTIEVQDLLPFRSLK